MSRRDAYTSRRHHYVPRFYLARFTDQKGRLRAHNRRTSRTITTTPTQVAVEKDFYRLPEASGLPSDFLERVLSAQEGAAARAIRTAAEEGAVGSSDQRTLALHLALQLLRTPNAREALGQMAEWSGGMLAQIELRRRLDQGEFTTDADRDKAERAIRQLADGELLVRPTKESLVGLSLAPLDKIVITLIEEWNWLVVVLPRPGFITTDHPLAMLGEPDVGSPASNVGPATALEVWFPLDPRHALVLSRDWSFTSPLIDLPDAHLRAINLRLALESGRWIFFRPRTDPLKGFQIPREPPRWSATTIGRREEGDGAIGELVRTGVERPYVPNERLLSGRRLRPFPRGR